MRKQNKRTTFEALPEVEKNIVLDTSISPEVASFMTQLSSKQISNMRRPGDYREARRIASSRKREKMKQENLERFEKPHGCYNYWTAAEIKYILTSKDSDQKMSEKLNRTIYAIQQKRSRELRKRSR